MVTMVTMGAMALVVVRWGDVTQHSARYVLSMGRVGTIVDLCAGGSAVRHKEVSCRKYSEYLIVFTYWLLPLLRINHLSYLLIVLSFKICTFKRLNQKFYQIVSYY
jgi:hypothetical protein